MRHSALCARFRGIRFASKAPTGGEASGLALEPCPQGEGLEAGSVPDLPPSLCEQSSNGRGGFRPGVGALLARRRAGGGLRARSNAFALRAKLQRVGRLRGWRWSLARKAKGWKWAPCQIYRLRFASKAPTGGEASGLALEPCSQGEGLEAGSVPDLTPSLCEQSSNGRGLRWVGSGR